MYQSHLFSKTLREAPKEEVSANAIFLTRAGYIDKLTAGVYSYLPLGLKVLNKIKEIVRQEMDALGAQEILMPALTPKENWLITGRWDKIDVLFKLKGLGDKDYALGSTHEEVVTPLVKKFAASYRDLPLAVYQIQDKFRNEPRAKSGLLRGREFSMKDLYSFHATAEDLEGFYERAKIAYLKVFKRCGLEAIVTEASGGVFSQYSHEFQVLTEYGEDQIVACSNCSFAQNKEICSLTDGQGCPSCQQPVKLKKAIEVGNIFKLNARFSEAFKYCYSAEDGKLKPVLMGCYGIGPSRLLGAVAEVYHDQQGLIWPKTLTPFQAHLILLDQSQSAAAEKLYQSFLRSGLEILFDNRAESAGVKLKDADLLGITCQFIIGSQSPGQLEYRLRDGSKKGTFKPKEAIKFLQEFYV